MGNSKFKYSLIVEGKNEVLLFNELKDSIYQARTLSRCRKHCTKIQNFTKEIIEDNNIEDVCCVKIFIFDVDKNDLKTMLDYRKKVIEKKNIFIINNPSLEIVLLSFFKNITKPYIKQDYLNKELKNELEKWKIQKYGKNDKYKHDGKTIYKIIDFFSKDKTDFKIKFKERLETLNKEEVNPTTNFIEIISKFEETFE